MNPSSEQIEKWAQHTDDGWVKIPASSWPDLLWCLREAEKAERRLELLRTDEYDAVMGEQEALAAYERAKVVLQMIGGVCRNSTHSNAFVALRDIEAHLRAFELAEVKVRGLDI